MSTEGVSVNYLIREFINRLFQGFGKYVDVVEIKMYKDEEIIVHHREKRMFYEEGKRGRK